MNHMQQISTCLTRKLQTLKEMDYQVDVEPIS